MTKDKFEIKDELEESDLLGEEIIKTSKRESGVNRSSEVVQEAGELTAKEFKKEGNINKNKKKPIAAKSEKQKTMLAILGIVVVVVGILGYFVYSTMQDMKGNNTSEKDADYAAPPVENEGIHNLLDNESMSSLREEAEEKPAINLKEENSEVLAQAKLEKNTIDKKIKTVALGEDNSKRSTQGKNVPQQRESSKAKRVIERKKESINVATKKSIPSAEKEMMGISKPINKSEGGVCDLSIKYKLHLKYIPYFKINNEYLPAFKTNTWDKKGLKLTRRVVVLSHDKKYKFTEIEKGIYFPSEMFSQCSSYKKSGVN